MRKLSVLIPILTMAIVSHGPARAEPVLLKPKSQWNVDFGEDRCRLARLFSDGDNEHVLYFEQHYPSVTAGLTVGGRSLTRFEDRAETLVQTADGHTPLKTQPLKGEMQGFGDALIYPSLNLARDAQPANLPGLGPVMPSLDTAFADTVTYLSFRQGKREVQFNTGPLGNAFKVLNQCSESLIDTWGLDAEQHRTMMRRPRWNNQQEVAKMIVDRYPAGAARAGEQGVTRMRVIIDAQGKAESCVIDRATKADSLKSPACQVVMKEGSFEPGLDAAGKPMRSYFATTITYQLD